MKRLAAKRGTQLVRGKSVEEALRVSEERYALAMTGSDEGHWVWDFASGDLYISPTFKQLFRVPADAPMATHEEAWGWIPVHPEDRPRVDRLREAHLAGRTPRFDAEYRIVDPCGGIRWIHSRGQCFRDTRGAPIRMAGSTIEVTERKRAEEALRMSEERFALAVAGSNDGIWDWDVRNDRMFTSERAQRILGMSPLHPEFTSRVEWIGRLKVHPDDEERRVRDFTDHLERRSPVRDGDYRVRHADGVYHWVRFRGLCIRDEQGAPIRMAGSVTDIDAQKEVEEALRLSQERYQLAVAGSNEGLWDWDLLRDEVFLAPRAQAMFGVAPSDPVRSRREWQNNTVYHPDDRPRIRAAIGAHLRGLSTHLVIEYRAQHGSGEWHWYRQRGVAIRDHAGRAYRMAGSVEDITDRKRAESEKERLELQLRQAQRLEAMGTLAGGIAHDFNNILAAILGYGEMAQRQLAEGTRVRTHVDNAISAALRAKSLVERILAFSRSGIGERMPVHVQSAVSEALGLVGSSLPLGVRLERTLACGDAAVTGDPVQIHQVVMNLCANAIQSMRWGGLLVVALETEMIEWPRHVSTTTLAPGQYLRLRVRDTGHGIAPNIVERIFDPFFTTKEVGVGTGLGLSLVHGIVTELGGGVDVQSVLDEGSVFTVYLPRSGSTQPADAIVEPPTAGAGQVILLVDDEEALVELGEEMIAGLGYEPVGFTSSAAAVAAFQAAPQRFDAVLSDEMMPGMTGCELAGAVRGLRPDIPIILMTGYASPGLAARARAVGVREVLEKPLISRDIARSLAAVLRH